MSRRHFNRWWILGVFGVLSALLIYNIVMRSAASRGLRAMARFYQGQLLLTSNDCRQLSTDLASQEPARLAIWKLYFERAAEGHIVNGQPQMEFKDVISVYSNLYQTREAPARSHYFGLVLAATAQKATNDVVLLSELLGYLGTPDGVSNTVQGKLLQYKFTASGNEAIGVVEAQNERVVAVRIELVHQAK
jgi:hypothetical protein